MAQPAGQFRNGGASQAERLPVLLSPERLALDGRTLPELLAYLSRLSRQVGFYTNPALYTAGTWDLARHRSLLLLAEVATQPLMRRTEEVTARLQPLRQSAASPAQQYQARQLLLKLLYWELSRLNRLVLYHRGSNRQPAFAAALAQAVRELAPGLREAAHYELLLLRTGLTLGEGPPRLSEPPARWKGQPLSAGQALAGGLVRDFGAALPGGLAWPGEAANDRLAESYADQLRDGRQTPATVTEQLLELLWQTYKAQVELADVARQELDDALRGRADLHPELGLLVAVAQLYAHAQHELNDIPRRHLDYYYEQVLHARHRPSQPDHAYLSFGLAEGRPRYLLPAGTVLDGGKDEAGRRVLFATDADADLGSWRVAALATLLVARADAGAGTLAGPVAGVYSSALRDPATGAGPGADADARWPLFGADPARHPTSLDPLQPAELGFAVAAPVLALQEGLREITVRLRASSDSFERFWKELPPDAGDRQRLLFGAFEAQGTGPAGWLPLQVVAVVADPTDNTLSWTLRLERDQPPLVAYGPARHGGQLGTTQPVLRLLLSPSALTYGYSYFFRLTPAELRVLVSVKHMRGSLELSNQLGPLDGSGPFYPFGAQGMPGAGLLVGAGEWLGKNITSITLALTWQNLPSEGLAAYYAPYTDDAAQVFADDAFRVKASYLADYRWQEALRAPVRLFAPGPAGGPALGSYTLLTLRRPGRLTPAPGGAVGLVRVALAGPAPGFGAELYPQALAATVQYNARHRRRPRPLPPPPFIPMLRQLTASYSAEEIVLPAPPGSLAGFYHLHPFFGYAPANAGAVRLLPLLPDEGTLLVGLTPDAAGRDVQLLFDLSVPAATEQVLPVPEWTFLEGDEWRPLAQAGGYADAAPGFANSCRVRLTLPDRPGIVQHQLLPGGWCWLRATVPGRTADFGLVRALHVRLVPATRLREGTPAPAPYQGPLAPGTLTRLLQPQPGIVAVAQPGPSWGGRAAETQPAYYTRVSEQLRHRGRALTPWDYERLLLEQFPDVHSAKCLTPDQLPLVPATAKAGEAPRYVRQVGVVEIVVLPRPDLLPDSALPVFGSGQLALMQDYLQGHASPAARVRVRNVTYEQVQVRATVAFRPAAGGGQAAYEPLLQAALSAYLSPWGHEQAQQGGFHRHLTLPGIAAFLQQQPYVAGSTALSVVKTGVLDGRHRFYDSATDARQPALELGALAPWAVLVPAPQHVLSVVPTPPPPRPPAPTGIGSLRIEQDLAVADDF
jgi:hypothetical protein